MESKHSKRCIIAIPVYKPELTLFEAKSLKQCFSLLGSKYDIVLFGPKGLNLKYYTETVSSGSLVYYSFPEAFFKSNITYSSLMVHPDFYAYFQDYEYMLIYQLDGWLFSDKLEEFMDMGYDYIGAPHFHYDKNHNPEYAVGNGGVSLRNIKSIKETLIKYSNVIKRATVLEDRIFGEVLIKIIKVAPLDVAARFSFHDEPEKFFHQNGDQLPMAAHAIEKHWEFYENYLEIYPKVSIVVPVYNTEKYVRETLSSIKNQTYTNWECIIVNDGSTDGSENIILDYIKNDKRFFYFYQPNSGCAKARNTAIKNAIGKYIFPLDSDDQMMNDFIERAIIFMEFHPEIKVYYPQMIHFDDKVDVWNVRHTDYKTLLLCNDIPACSLYYKSDWERIQGYDETMKGYEDWEFWIRLLYHNDHVYKSDSLGLLIRVRANSLNKKAMQNHEELVLKIYSKNKAIFNEHGIYLTHSHE